MRDYNCLDGMIANGESMLKTAYDKGYNHGTKYANNANTVKILDASYNKGMKDMYDVFHKLLASYGDGGMMLDDVEAIFGTDDIPEICERFKDDPKLLIENIKEYEDGKKSEKETKICGFMNDLCPYMFSCDTCAVAKVVTDAKRDAKEVKNG